MTGGEAGRPLCPEPRGNAHTMHSSCREGFFAASCSCRRMQRPVAPPRKTLASADVTACCERRRCHARARGVGGEGEAEGRPAGGACAPFEAWCFLCRPARLPIDLQPVLPPSFLS